MAKTVATCWLWLKGEQGAKQSTLMYSTRYHIEKCWLKKKMPSAVLRKTHEFCPNASNDALRFWSLMATTLSRQQDKACLLSDLGLNLILTEQHLLLSNVETPQIDWLSMAMLHSRPRSNQTNLKTEIIDHHFSLGSYRKHLHSTVP